VYGKAPDLDIDYDDYTSEREKPFFGSRGDQRVRMRFVVGDIVEAKRSGTKLLCQSGLLLNSCSAGSKGFVGCNKSTPITSGLNAMSIYATTWQCTFDCSPGLKCDGGLAGPAGGWYRGKVENVNDDDTFDIAPETEICTLATSDLYKPNLRRQVKYNGGDEGSNTLRRNLRLPQAEPGCLRE
jgi:hypothetical protein